MRVMHQPSVYLGLHKHHEYKHGHNEVGRDQPAKVALWVEVAIARGGASNDRPPRTFNDVVMLDYTKEHTRYEQIDTDRYG